MYPQAELENYKLQVELLQEKLQRSEGNRQQLEHKLDKILQKRCEFEKASRHKTRQKYQEFLEEQAKRNERNKKLIHMLERIDEQTAAMSQRSERLKMMKLQYQMYFAKLVQNQTLRCIQQTSTPTAAMPQAIPVLVAPQTAAAAATATATPTAPSTSTLLLGNQTMPDAAAAPQWTFAMATPTQAGMLLSTPRAANAADFMQFAVSQPSQLHPLPQAQPVYMPLPELFSNAATCSTAGGGNLCDLRATLRALDSENADLPAHLMPGRYAADYAADKLLPGEYQQAVSNGSVRTATAATTTSDMPSIGTNSDRDKSLHELSSTSSTRATSSLTFDKLPKTMTTAAMSAMPAMSGTSPALTLTELPQTTLCVDNRRQRSSSSNNGSGNSINVQPKPNDVAWAPNSCVTKAEHEKLPSVAAVAANNEQSYLQEAQQLPQLLPQQQTSKFEAYFGELKIDEPPWQPATPQQSASSLNSPQAWPEDTLNMQTAARATRDSDDDVYDEFKASREALEKAAAEVEEQLARGGIQLSPTICSSPTASDVVVAKPSLSIENIENAIYGERVTTTVAAPEAAVEAAGNALLARQQQQQEPPLLAMEATVEPTAHDVGHIDYGQYEATAYAGREAAMSEASYEPTYASIEGTTAAAAAAQQEQQQPSGEPIYSEIGNPTDYQQYAADVNATGQDYSNIDYGNYDATQYAGGYDPNAYPGYIYDEASGQYIADPSAAQYATDDSYAAQAQEYEASAAAYDYNAVYGQQQPVESYALPAAEPTAAAENLSAELAEVKNEATPAVAAAPAPVPVTATAAKHVTPTSILTSADKQATPNDAQQQSQQQQSQQQKKKKRVNFVDSSETDESSSAKPPPQGGNGTANDGGTTQPATANATAAAVAATTNAGSESDFDFSTGSEAKN